jgi:tRNA A22 N-methylase
MHDAEKLRRYLLQNGAYIQRDFTFSDVKFYDVICGGKLEEGGHVRDYSDAEYEFGRENLETMPAAFVEKIEKWIKNTDEYLANPALQEDSRNALETRKKRLQGVLSGEIK